MTTFLPGGALVAYAVGQGGRLLRPSPHSVLEWPLERIPSCLMCLVWILGALLLVLGALLWYAPELDQPPMKRQGERGAREGRWVVLVGMLFPVVSMVFLKMGNDVEIMLVPALAQLVFALWGGGRVLVAAGWTQRPGKQLLLGGLMVVLAGGLSLAQQWFLWKAVP